MQGPHRSSHDIQPIAVLELDDLTAFAGNKAYDSIKEDSVGQIGAGSIELRVGGRIRHGAISCAAVIGAIHR